MNPWEKELIDSLQDFVERVVKKRKEEGVDAVVAAMQKQLDSLDNSDELKEKMKNMDELQAKEEFLKAIETDSGTRGSYWHYGGDY